MSQRISPRPASTSWRYYDNAEPTITSVEDSSVLPPNHYSNDIRKTDLNDKFDVKKALMNIPKSERQRATKLLKEIELRSAEMTFDSEGTIYIEGESIEQSNFFKFLPYLYKKRQPKNMPGFADFLLKLQSMGLQNLFVLKSREKSVSILPKTITKQASNDDFWWVLN